MIRPNCPLVVKYKLEKQIPDVEVDVSTYKNSKSILKFTHKLYGEYYSTYNRASRQGGFHPKVLSQFRKQINLYTYEKANKLLNTIGLHIKKETYISFSKKCVVIDKEYGEWETIPASVFSRKGNHPKKALKLLGQNSKLSEQEISSILKDRGITIKYETYINTSEKAIFIDEKYGEWEAKVINVLYNKSNHPERGQANRSLASNRRLITKHWKTNKDLVCVGSYECFFVEWLNKNKIDFEWQICFNLSNKQRYFIDCYLPEYNIYIEIKGRERDDWKEKWRVFNSDNIGIKSTVVRFEDLKKIGYIKQYHESLYFSSLSKKVRSENKKEEE